jgi:hypothetical protein
MTALTAPVARRDAGTLRLAPEGELHVLHLLGLDEVLLAGGASPTSTAQPW